MARDITPKAAADMRHSLNVQTDMRNWAAQNCPDQLPVFEELSVVPESDGEPARYEVRLPTETIVFECRPGFDVYLDRDIPTYRRLEADDVARVYARPLPGADPAVACLGSNPSAVKSINAGNAAASIVVLPAKAN